MSYTSGGVVVLTSRHTTNANSGYSNKTDEEIIDENFYSLLHETSHHLGVRDHYCAKDNDPITDKCSNKNCDTCYGGFSDTRTCVMGDKRDIVTTAPFEDVYCSECKENILNHLESHH